MIISNSRQTWVAGHRSVHSEGSSVVRFSQLLSTRSCNYRLDSVITSRVKVPLFIIYIAPEPTRRGVVNG